MNGFRVAGLAVVVGGAIALTGGAAHAGSDLFEAGPGGFPLQAGGFVAVSPKYEGSDEYRVIGAPIIFPSSLGGVNGSGFVQFKGPDDLRFRVLNFNGFEAGPVLGYRFDRDEDDADKLIGLGDVDGGLLVGGFAAYRFGTFSVFGSYNHQVTGDDTGGQFKFGAENIFRLSHTVSLTASAGATWADEDYMDAYFGVNAAQSARSGLALYDADSGIKDVYLGLSGNVDLSERWKLIMTGRYSRLVGDAADSPIIDTENQFFGGLGLTYKFNFGG